MKEQFEKRKLTGGIKVKMDGHPTMEFWIAKKEEVIEKAIGIVERYEQEGFKLTLRQLYYQLVSLDVIPNNDKVYKKLGSILSDCRIAGEIDWDSIEDRGRVPYLPYYNHDINDAIASAARHFRLDRQDGQENVVEIWVEKDALSGILRKMAYKYHIRLVVNKGYSSDTAMYEAYKRFAGYFEDNKHVTILYFGDHDPSGIDMLRDIEHRLRFMLCNGDFFEKFKFHFAKKFPIPLTEEETDIMDYCEREVKDNDGDWSPQTELAHKIETLRNRYRDENDEYLKGYKYLDNEEIEGMKGVLFASNLSVKRIALTQEQIQQYGPPSNPAKIDDPRADTYIAKYGNISWEVDALSPSQIIEILEDAILEEIDVEMFDARVKKEQAELKKLKSLMSGVNTDDNE